MNSYFQGNIFADELAAPKQPLGQFKTCMKCGATKPLHEFAVQPSGKSHRNDCKCCQKEAQKIVRELRKTAPPKPDHCQCCKKPKQANELVLDHDHETREFRGWVCDGCNRGMGFLGDDVKGALNFINYLLNPTTTETDA